MPHQHFKHIEHNLQQLQYIAYPFHGLQHSAHTLHGFRYAEQHTAHAPQHLKHGFYGF
jgi:hypothetical protein